MKIIAQTRQMVQPIALAQQKNPAFMDKLKALIEKICNFVKSLFARFFSRDSQEQVNAAAPLAMRTSHLDSYCAHEEEEKAGKEKAAAKQTAPASSSSAAAEPESRSLSAEYVMNFFGQSYLGIPQEFRFQVSKAESPKAVPAHVTHETVKKYEKICDVEVRQQARNLFLLGDLLKLPHETFLPIQVFCQKTTEAADVWQSCTEKLEVEQARQIIARLIFLTGLCPDEAAEIIRELPFVAAVEKINGLYTKKLHGISKKIYTAYKLHLKTGLQDETRALQNLLATEIAICLIPAAGVFNAEIIPDVLKMLTPTTHMGTHHYGHIQYVLKCLLESGRLWCKLQHIKAPESPYALAANLIAIALDLPQGRAITDREAQQTALAGLLSHARQGKVGSCFASFLTTELLSANLELCLDDFGALLHQGVLTRLVNKRLMQFPFRLSISKDHVKQSIELDSTGKRRGSRRKLWHAPGIIAACKALSLNNPKDAIVSLLSPMFLKCSTERGTIRTTIDEILKNLAAQAKNNHHDQRLGIGELYLKALYAYESQTSNPLLQAWENVIAGMAEGTENSYIKPRMVDSILFGLEMSLSRKERSLQINEKILEAVKQSLQIRMQLQFSPHVQHDRGDDDGNSGGGAFVVYDTRRSPHPNRWALVGGPDVFVHFVQRILDEVCCRLLREQQVDPLLLKEAIDSLTHSVETKKFIIQCIRKCGYHQVKNPVEDWQKIDNTPWMFKAGTNPKTVLQIYFELEKPPELNAVWINNVEQLLEKLVEVVGKHRDWLKKCDHTHVMLPTSIQGLHVFMLLPKHPTFWPIVCGEEPVSEVLQKRLINPGWEISHRKVLNATRKKIIDRCLKELIPDTAKQRYKSLTDHIRKDCSLKVFIDHLLEIHLDLLGEDVHDARIALDLDRVMIESLLEVQRQTLAQSAIQFADTNWFHGVHNVHFCLMYNPRTGMELAKIDDNNENLTPIDQNYWLLAHPWEFYP